MLAFLVKQQISLERAAVEDMFFLKKVTEGTATRE